MSHLADKRVLVVGGAGYIGSFTVHALLAAGATVAVFDDLSYGHRRALPQEAIFIQGSLEKQQDIRHAINEARPDAVFHFAALASVPESMRHPYLYFKHNLTWTMHLLEEMGLAGVTKCVFSSTCATFGVPQSALDELHPQDPINPYGASKLAVEVVLRSLAHSHGVSSAVLRYFNACGAALDGSRGEHHTPETHLIPNVVDAALGLKPALTLYGDNYQTPDGTCIRDYVHVEDLAQAHIKALEALYSEESTGSGVWKDYNIGTGRGFSIKEIIHAVEQCTGRRVPLTIAAPRPGDPPSLVASSDRIQIELGWMPQHSDLDTIIRSVVAWRTRYPRGYEEV
jgi:UDP-glucose 4-epimerase